MTVVHCDEIHRAYEAGKDVLRGVTFSVGKGEVVGLLGKNGAGKTTLMRIALGMLEPQRGAVRVFGLDPRREPISVKQRVGFVAEDQILPEFLRVEQVVALHREIFPTWDTDLEQQLASSFDLDPGARIKTLSKGQARQVALLCALAHRPDLLLLDEPAGGLDPAARREFLETAIAMLNETGTTILFSSHYMSDVERLAGRVVMLHGGRVLVDRSLDDLRENHCLALVPRVDGVDRERLLGLDGCLGVRDRADALHAVFGLAPEAARSLLQDRLGITEARCHTVALEDMFIELAGGQA